MTDRPDLENWTCPLPLRDQTSIVMGHGGGGRLSSELVEHLFLPAFGGTALAGALEQLGDSAVLDLAGARLAFTTDSYVVRPRFFPGGNVGRSRGQRNRQRPVGQRRGAVGALCRADPRGRDAARRTRGDHPDHGGCRTCCRGLDRHRGHEGGRRGSRGRRLHQHRRYRAGPARARARARSSATGRQDPRVRTDRRSWDRCAECARGTRVRLRDRHRQPAA